MSDAKKPVVDATAVATAPVKAVKAPKEPKAPKEAKPPRAKLEMRNDVSRPSDPTKGTGLVWAIADKISAANKSPAARADVMTEATAAGINAATIATQYGKWRTFNGLKGQPAVKKAVVAATDANGVPTTPAAAAAIAAANADPVEAVKARAALAV